MTDAMKRMVDGSPKESSNEQASKEGPNKEELNKQESNVEVKHESSPESVNIEMGDKTARDESEEKQHEENSSADHVIQLDIKTKGNPKVKDVEIKQSEPGQEPKKIYSVVNEEEVAAAKVIQDNVMCIFINFSMFCTYCV